jgi:transcriptional regulator with XRE-family HTH domain
MANQFGERIRQLREENRLLLRQVAGHLNMDTPMLSKIERGERKAKKEQVPLFAKLLKTGADELLTLWLADQLVEVVEGESLGLKAIQMAEDEVKYHSKKRTRKS